MKILIATPTWGHTITTDYFESFLETINVLVDMGIEFHVMNSPIDLIARARNACAQAAIDGDFDKLLFIDSDLGYRGSDVATLLKSKKLIVGGTYPFKAYPLRMNFHALQTEKKGTSFRDFKKEFEDSNGEIEVKNLPTGFMLIDVSVLRALSETCEYYEDGDPVTGEEKTLQNFFPMEIENRFYRTEDWGFCHIAKKAGYKIYLNSNVILDHIGIHRFSVKVPLDKQTK